MQCWNRLKILNMKHDLFGQGGPDFRSGHKADKTPFRTNCLNAKLFSHRTERYGPELQSNLAGFSLI